jgi:hypothetical protein
MGPVANFIKLFQHNLHCYRHIASSFESGYADRGVNYIEKKFYEIDTWFQCYIIFCP